MISNLQKLFAEPLRDLGRDDPRFAGIFAPEAERGMAKTGVTAQFLENAAEYHERYNNVDGFRALIGRLLGTGIDGRFILDIGSGAGNSVIPLLDLYPNAYVVATDISPQLLAILREYLEKKPEYRGRYGLVCMDANHDRFRPGVFDLAVGAAILHHIVDPRRVLRACASALRPGGSALFLEPFEVGHGVLRIAYRRVLDEAGRRREKGPGFAMLQRMIVDHEARLRDKADPIFDVLDDKWFFTRSYFEEATRGPEWDECRVEAINCGAAPLVDHAKMELQLGLAADESALPPWAWKVIRDHEAYFSGDGCHDLLFEGAVILRRSAAATAPAPSDGPRAGWWWNPAEPGRGFFIEPDGDASRAACCVYGDDGEPGWNVAAPGAVDLSGGPRKIRLRVAGKTLHLEPQHAGLPGGAHTGWWIEDSPAPAFSVVIEQLGDRVMAALLSPDDWTLVVATQCAPHSFGGDWLRFTGGQTLSGPYRAPAAPRELGPARLSWTDGDCLVALMPDGRRRLFRRLKAGEPAAQNLRSTENCAS